LEVKLSRRKFLKSVVVTGGLTITVARHGVGRQTDTSRREFTWDDASHRREIEAAAVSPSGTVALQVTRPLTAPGLHAGFVRTTVQPRGDIWLIDASLANATKLTVGDTWLWAPCFSPLGSRLATICSSGDGRVGFAVSDPESLLTRLFWEPRVDLSAKFSCDGVADGCVRGRTVAKQFAWLDEDTLLFVDHGEEELQFEEAIAIGSANRTYAALRGLAAQGKTSVRVWNQDSPTCGVRRTISALHCKSGVVTPIYRGDARGISVSHDHLRLAALVATAHLNWPPNNSMPPELGLGALDDDPLVRLSLVMIEISRDAQPIIVGEVRGVGNVPPSRLPVWSADSKRVAVPIRGSYSSARSTNDDVCWEISTDNFKCRKWDASSALDAELLAAICVAFPSAEAENVIGQRPKLPKELNQQLSVGETEGVVYNCGARAVALFWSSSVWIVGANAAKRIAGNFRVLYSPRSTNRGAMMFAVRGDGTGSVISVRDCDASAADFSFGRAWVYLAARGSEGDVLAKEDAPTGTRLFAAGTRAPKRASAISYNRYLGEVTVPAVREVRSRENDGSGMVGVLQLPVGHMPGDRHPVIVWAYPDHLPALDSELTKVNSWWALWLPLQYLLTRGFAVFHAPLPTAHKRLGEPIGMVRDAVLPWLDVLDAQLEINKGEYGFFGHSNGGYAALALEATTNRFKSIIAMSAFPDLGANALSTALDKMTEDCAGDALQADRFYYEYPRQPYAIGSPFWIAEADWISNSPLYRMDSAETPLLLIEGEFDYSPRPMESVYSILKGRGVPVELAYYWGEGHILSTPGNIRDMWDRTEVFYKRFLRTANQ
jgi:dipeptidyl aminopeptidase/acylaminoacyl peptidase